MPACCALQACPQAKRSSYCTITAATGPVLAIQDFMLAWVFFKLLTALWFPSSPNRLLKVAIRTGGWDDPSHCRPEVWQRAKAYFGHQCDVPQPPEATSPGPLEAA